MLELVIPDSGPLITLGTLDRLDLLARFNCAIMVTDMVAEEVLRGPDTARDRSRFERWFAARGNRVQTVETTYGIMWKNAAPDVRARVKRLQPDAGELSLREFSDRIRSALPADGQALLLFEENAVKSLSFGDHVHLLHTYAFFLALERLGVVDSAEALHEELASKGRLIAKDTFERHIRAPRQTAFDQGRRLAVGF